MRLISVTEDNWMDVASLSVKEEQKGYVAPAIGILARGYVYRDCNVKIYVFENDGIIVGTALVREFTDEPLGYDLQQFMVDERYRRNGIALHLLYHTVKNLNFNDVKNKKLGTCIRPDNIPSMRLHENIGFKKSHRVIFLHQRKNKDGNYSFINIPHYSI